MQQLSLRGVFPWIYWFLHGLQKASHFKSVWKNEDLGKSSILQNSLKGEYAGGNISLCISRDET